jgi:hypothetical protein
MIQAIQTDESRPSRILFLIKDSRHDESSPKFNVDTIAGTSLIRGHNVPKKGGYHGKASTEDTF